MAADDWPLPYRVDISHGQVAYEVMGQGPPAVLVHGTPSTSYLWRQVAPALARHHTLYVYDLPGFGASTLSPSPGRLGLVRTQAEVLMELATGWGLDRPALVGHDIGGGVVMRAHLLHGLAAERIALIDAAVLAPWITARTRDMQRRLDQVRGLPVAEFSRLVLDHLGTATAQPLPDVTWQQLFGQWEGPDGQARYLDNLASFDEGDTDDFASLLPSVTVPVLMLWGETDRWLPLDMAHRLHGQLPTSELTVLPGAGHFAMEDRPELVVAALDDFVRSVSAG